MTRLIASSILMAGLLTAACSNPAQEPAQPEMNAPADLQAIDMLRTAFANAFTAGDADAVGALYSADAVSQTDMQPTATGRAAIVEQMKGTFSQFDVKMDITPEETHTMGNMGWERGRYTMMMTPKAEGQAMTMNGRYMIILEKGADGSWKVSRDMDNLPTMPPPMPAEAAK